MQSLSKLRSLKEIESFNLGVLDPLTEYDRTVEKSKFTSFVEPIWAQRLTLLAEMQSTDALVNFSLQYAENCRKRGLFQLALKKLSVLKSMEVG